MIAAVIAMTLLTFPDSSYDDLSPNVVVETQTRTADMEAPSHGAVGHASSAEEHSHPQVVMPAANMALLASVPGPWAWRDSVSLDDRKLRLDRPPKFLVL